MLKKIFFSLLGMAALIAIVVACSDNPSFDGQDDQNKELILKAKSLVQAQGNAVSLPAPNKNNVLSRSVKSFPQATPIWDKAWTERHGNSTILIVPLESEDIRAKISIKQGENLSYQFAKTFSRLIIQQIGEKIISGIHTYLPESNYANVNTKKLESMRYHPQTANFCGYILTSSIDGTIRNGYVLKNGTVQVKVKPSFCQKHSDCAQIDSITTNKTAITINFYDNLSASRSTTYTTDSETCKGCGVGNCTCGEEECTCILFEYFFCGICQQDYCDCLKEVGGICQCQSSNPIEYCDDCGHPKDQCICFNLDDTTQCPWCGMIYYTNEEHTCDENEPTPPSDDEKEPCPDCGKYTCECPEPPVQIDTCDICNQEPCACCDLCGTYPCVCVTNTTPIPYIAHNNDQMIGNESDFSGGADCCAMAVLAMAHRAYGADKTEAEIAQLYTQLNYVSPEESTILDANSTFMTLQFNTGTTTQLASTALSNVIVVRYENHYILVVGVQYDGDLIYADPHSGGLYVVNASYFSGCENIVVYGSGSKSLKLNN